MHFDRTKRQWYGHSIKHTFKFDNIILEAVNLVVFLEEEKNVLNYGKYRFGIGGNGRLGGGEIRDILQRTFNSIVFMVWSFVYFLCFLITNVQVLLRLDNQSNNLKFLYIFIKLMDFFMASFQEHLICEKKTTHIKRTKTGLYIHSFKYRNTVLLYTTCTDGQ